MNIPLVDLHAQYESIREEIDAAIRSVLESGQFILGPEVKALEEEIASYVGTKHAVGVGSGTDALHLALLAAGIGPGDEVITTPFTFIATVDMLMHCGASPVFVDIDPATLNIDAARIESRITPKTRAILPVHLFGLPADMEAIMALAETHGLVVIEDCAQSLGSEWRGRKMGSIGLAGCLSFFPSKSLGACGDGGMVVTDSAEIAGKVDKLRRHGATRSYYYDTLGYNSRLDAIQAAILRVKLRHLDEWNRRRRRNAAYYAEKLRDIPDLEIPAGPDGSLSCFSYYTLRLTGGTDRDALRDYLKEKGIATMVYYPLSLHLQEACRTLGYRAGDFPVSESAQERVLSLPMYPELSEEQIDHVAGVIKDYFRGR